MAIRKATVATALVLTVSAAQALSADAPLADVPGFPLASKRVPASTEECAVWVREPAFAKSVEAHDEAAWASHLHPGVVSNVGPEPDRGIEAVRKIWPAVSGRGHSILRWRPGIVNVSGTLLAAVSLGPCVYQSRRTAWTDSKSGSTRRCGCATRSRAREGTSSTAKRRRRGRWPTGPRQTSRRCRLATQPLRGLKRFTMHTRSVLRPVPAALLVLSPLFVFQAMAQELAITSNESVDLFPVYWIKDCRSLLTSFEAADVLDGPAGVTVTIWEQGVLPQRQGCPGKVHGGVVVASAGDIRAKESGTLRIRVRHKMIDGSKQSTHAV